MIHPRLLFPIALCLTLSVARAEDTQGLVVPFKSVSVASPVLQEVVEAVLVEEGDTVKEGQIIVKLRDEREMLDVERTEKIIELAQFKSKGAEALFAEKMGSKEKALEERAQLDLTRIQHRLAEAAFREKTIRAPLSGIVVKKHKENGESVDRAEKLVEIVNIDQVYVQFYLDPKLWTSLKLDQPVKVKIPVIGAAEFAGKISFIDPRIDAGSNLFRVKVLIDNADHQIKAGMRGTADFGTGNARK